MIDHKVVGYTDAIFALADQFLADLHVAGYCDLSPFEGIMAGIGWGIALTLAGPEYAQALLEDRPVERRMEVRAQMQAFMAAHPVTSEVP